jgi:hypothetical protein
MRAAYGNLLSLTDPRNRLHDRRVWESAPTTLEATASNSRIWQFFQKNNLTEPKLAKEHLIKLYQRTTFYELMALSRVRKSKKYCKLGMYCGCGYVWTVKYWCFKKGPNLFWIFCKPNNSVIENDRVMKVESVLRDGTALTSIETNYLAWSQRRRSNTQCIHCVWQ